MEPELAHCLYSLAIIFCGFMASKNFFIYIGLKLLGRAG